MFGPLGVPELIFIFVLALLIFGPRRLPELGKTLGRAMGEFRRATSDLKSSFDTELALEEEQKKQRPRPADRPRPVPAERPEQAADEPEERPVESGG